MPTRPSAPRVPGGAALVLAVARLFGAVPAAAAGAPQATGDGPPASVRHDARKFVTLASAGKRTRALHYGAKRVYKRIRRDGGYQAEEVKGCTKAAKKVDAPWECAIWDSGGMGEIYKLAIVRRDGHWFVKDFRGVGA